jgi:glycosyltransferase involved in cell wall biosynthesis
MLMKVLLVVTGLTMGGAERVVTDLADAFVAAGSEVLLVYLKGPAEVLPQRPEVKRICLHMESAKDLLTGYVKFARIVRRFQPDVVHAHMFHAAMLARLVRPIAAMPVLVSTMHTPFVGGRFRALTYRVTDRLTDISTNVSSEAVATFVDGGAIRAGRMLTVYNGIAVDEFRPLPAAGARIRETLGVGPASRLLLAAGRLGWSKDYPNLFRALEQLPSELDYAVLIAGDGPLRQSLKEMAADLGIAPRVRFLGIRQDIAELMSAADVFVLSSIGESFGLVVAEAMACECVVVATDSGGVREVLGDAGFLVPTRNPAALAQALLAASMMDKPGADAMGQAARRRIVDLYSFDRSVERWLELYESLLANASSHARAPDAAEDSRKPEAPLARP